MVNQYFATTNRAVPLFDRAPFLELVTGWYSGSIERDKTAWAAIAMVTALGIKAPRPKDAVLAETCARRNSWVNECLQNAQAVIPDLVSRQTDLLGLQVLIALAMVFHTGSDARPAGYLISMAMKLAQSMQMNSSRSAQFLSQEEVRLRSRVFWILYTFDKVGLEQSVSRLTIWNISQSQSDINLQYEYTERFLAHQNAIFSARS